MTIKLDEPQRPLLGETEQPRSASGDVEAPGGTERWLKFPSLFKEVLLQGKISAPLSVGLVANYLLSVISLSFVGHLGTAELAAAALATTLYSMTAKILLAGMLGALDTYASQAVGARNYEALGSMFRQAVLFLMLHTIPIAAVFASLPSLLRRLGQPEDLTRLLGPYLLALLPGVWIDAVYRPFNRILVAQHVTLPQMWISCAVAVQHVGATYLFIHTFRAGYVGAAYSTVWSSLLATVLVGVYVRASNLHLRVWASPNGVVFQSWRPYIKLSYSACAMRAIRVVEPELVQHCSWLAARPCHLLGCHGSVGNGLGAGSAPMAKLSALAAAATVPPLYSVLAAVLAVPASQRAVINLFTSESDPQLLLHMGHLLTLLAVLLFFDMGQSVMSGVASGAGKQTKGFAINTVAHWGFALPAALLLGFYFRLGVEGLYLGVVLGPMTQWVCYAVLLWRMDWDREAELAHWRMLQATASTEGAGI